MVVHGKPRQTTENTNLLDAKENNELLDNFHTFHFSRLMLANGALMLAITFRWAIYRRQCLTDEFLLYFLHH